MKKLAKDIKTGDRIYRDAKNYKVIRGAKLLTSGWTVSIVVVEIRITKDWHWTEVDGIAEVMKLGVNVEVNLITTRQTTIQ